MLEIIRGLHYVIPPSAIDAPAFHELYKKTIKTVASEYLAIEGMESAKPVAQPSTKTKKKCRRTRYIAVAHPTTIPDDDDDPECQETVSPMTIRRQHRQERVREVAQRRKNMPTEQAATGQVYGTTEISDDITTYLATVRDPKKYLSCVSNCPQWLDKPCHFIYEHYFWENNRPSPTIHGHRGYRGSNDVGAFFSRRRRTQCDRCAEFRRRIAR